MKRTFFLLLTIFLVSGNACAGSRDITFFSDSAAVEIELTASKGIAEMPLPVGISENSLHIKPVSGGTVRQVETIPSRQDSKREKELDGLLEQKRRLNDRLQALDTKEEIFKAAAKSQSSKAPRKTKNNPDPMQSIHQGTEFAIARLESVYTARRKTNQEIKRVDNRIAELKRNGSLSAKTIRVAVSPRNAKIRIRYILANQGWTPRYDMRIKGDGFARVILYGQIPSGFNGYRLYASSGTAAESGKYTSITAYAGQPALLNEFRLPVKDESFGSTQLTTFSATINNNLPIDIPPGEASLFRKEEYMGNFHFEGISSARSKRITNTRQ